MRFQISPFPLCLSHKHRGDVCRIIYGGGHKDKTINDLMLKLINNMNNNRLSTSKKLKSKSELTNNELTLLNNVSSTYKYLPDGSIINRKTGIVLTVICIYIVILSNGEDKIIATREEIARELNINVNTLSNKLKLHREGVKINDSFVKRVIIFAGSQSRYDRIDVKYSSYTPPKNFY